MNSQQIDHMMSGFGNLSMSGGLEEDLDGARREMAKIAYICGGNCSAKNETWFIGCGREQKLDRESLVRCMHCSHRIFYKKRERKLLQYLAR
jgi:DNA-directed RNA polymerase subunit RPC12/RpoP